ncbi:MAG: hypothetical protein OIF32_12305, partial [Campylobacterales bacterium]|nr:hypothetical protein [Campylobacterales bacterium]
YLFKETEIDSRIETTEKKAYLVVRNDDSSISPMLGIGKKEEKTTIQGQSSTTTEKDLVLFGFESLF